MWPKNCSLYLPSISLSICLSISISLHLFISQSLIMEVCMMPWKCIHIPKSCHTSTTMRNNYALEVKWCINLKNNFTTTVNVKHVGCVWDEPLYCHISQKFIVESPSLPQAIKASQSIWVGGLGDMNALLTFPICSY